MQTEDMFVWRRQEIDLPPDRRRPYLRDILGQKFDPWYGAELSNPVSFGHALFDQFVAEVLRPDETTRVCGFMEIRYAADPAFFARYLDILDSFFPNARFIFQTRGYESVAKSNWWKNVPLEQVRKYVETADGLFANYRQERLNCHHIRFEDYRDGLEVARNLFAFLDEPFDEPSVKAVLDHKLKHGK